MVSLFCAEVRILFRVTCSATLWDCTEIRLGSWCHLQRSALYDMSTGTAFGDVAGYAGRRVLCCRRNCHASSAAGHRGMMTSGDGAGCPIESNGGSPSELQKILGWVPLVIMSNGNVLKQALLCGEIDAYDAPTAILKIKDWYTDCRRARHHFLVS